MSKARPFSGKFVLRIPADLHAELVRLAHEKKQSLNAFCLELLRRGADAGLNVSEKPSSIVTDICRVFQPSVCGVLLFGSQARGEATALSDVDLLIVMEKGIPISRKLYRTWDEKVLPLREAYRPFSPQFVSLIDHAKHAGSVWLEAAVEGIVLWERAGRPVSGFLREVRDLIAQGVWQRRMAHGSPYWIHIEGKRRAA